MSNVTSEPPVREDTGGIAGTGINIKIHWHVYAMAVWLAVVLTLSLWVIVRFRKLRKFHAGKLSTTDLPQWFDALLAEMVKKLGLRKSPEIVLSRNISSPAVFGVYCLWMLFIICHTGVWDIFFCMSLLTLSAEIY